MEYLNGLGPAAATRVLHCSKAWLKVLVAQGRIKATRTPLGMVLDAESVEEYRRAREAKRQLGSRGGAAA